MEQKTWWKAITYPERIDYVSFQYNELVFVLAIEQLLELEVPPRATWMRMLLCELTRIHSHLVWLGTAALELGAISMFWYCFRERDRILDLFELVTGVRMHTRYFQAGGLAEEIPPGFFDECAKFVEVMPKAINEYEAMVDRSQIWLERTQGIGLLSADDAIALGQSGPVLRASGVDWDLRREQPYLAYDNVDFRVPVRQEGDVYARYRVRMEEMRESVRIVDQALRRMPGGPWITDDRKVMLPTVQLAQEQHGYLSPDALRECADALGTTPAVCEAVASFYDMLHLAPVGRHMVEVCTNVSCALVGAQQVLEAFELELGTRAGETTADGEVTLRPIECLGGCGWATVVSVDHRYRTHVKPGDVPAIVQELRSGE